MWEKLRTAVGTLHRPPVSHQIVFFGAFEQRRSAVTVVGEKHLQGVLAAQVEAAKDGP